MEDVSVALIVLRRKIAMREPGRDGKILSDHRQDGNDEAHRLQVRFKKQTKKNATMSASLKRKFDGATGGGGVS